MSSPTSRYRRAYSSGALRQGEIVSNVIQERVAINTIGTKKPMIIPVRYDYAVVVSQDCDLEWDWDARQKGEQQDEKEEKKRGNKLMSSVLFCEAQSKRTLGSERGYNSGERRKISKNELERFHFLERLEAESKSLGDGIPDLTVDFKRCFSLPPDEVYFRLGSKELQRRILLNYPYLHDLMTRFWYFHCRVALPVQLSTNKPVILPAC